MPTPQTDEALLFIDSAGRYTDANETALELLGVSRAELLTSPPDRFAIEPSNPADQAALKTEWESQGARPLVGTAGLRRADGTTLRVSYAVEKVGAGFRARLSTIGGSPEAPPSVFSVGDVLREWRAAERGLAELTPGTPAWDRRQAEIEILRGRYQQLFHAVETGSSEP